MKYRNLILPSVLAGFAVAASANAATNLISNGDFETGDKTGWTVSGTDGSSVVTTGALSGTYSLQQVRATGHYLQQNLSSTLTSGPATITLTFEFTGDTTGTGNRLFQMAAVGSSGSVNMRVDAGGTLQVLSGSTTWNDTTIPDLSFGTTYSLALDFYDIGGSTTYDISVGANSQTGLSLFQSNAFGDFTALRFQSNNNYDSSTLLIDNVSVVVPEPSTVLLGGLGLLAFLRRRR